MYIHIHIFYISAYTCTYLYKYIHTYIYSCIYVSIRVYWNNTYLYIHISLRIKLLHRTKDVHLPPERVKETCRIQTNLQGVDRSARCRQAPKARQKMGKTQRKHCARSSMMQCVAVCWECCGMTQSRHRARISVLQCVAVCCSVLQCVAVCCGKTQQRHCARSSVGQRVAVSCSVLRQKPSKGTMNDHLEQTRVY